MPDEQATSLAEAHLVELLPDDISFVQILSMAHFASEAELHTFLDRIDSDYSRFASTLWQHGVKTPRQLAHATKPLLLSWGLPELYVDDIKATADRPGEPNACTLCLIVHRC